MVADEHARLRRLIEVTTALSVERDLEVLLDRILACARELTGADAGTVYTREGDRLHPRVIHNDTLGLRLRAAQAEDRLGTVAVEPGNVSGYAALHGKTVHVADVYRSDEFDFQGPRRYDAQTGYRSRSMLVVPLTEPGGRVIGVLQLLNARQAETGQPGPFRDEDVELVEAFASGAAAALRNARLVEDLRATLEGLVRALGVAIDAKSRYTGNHVQRVAELNVGLAQAIHRCEKGPLAGVRFGEEELEEIRLAGWLHDIGKVTTPVYVMDKANRLQGFFDRIEVIRERFRRVEAVLLERIRSGDDPAENARRLDAMREDWAFVEAANRPGPPMGPEQERRLKRIASEAYGVLGPEERVLAPEELETLARSRGSLTPEEMEQMREHVVWTARMLGQIPFPPHLSRVPEIASAHHERLDGTGYPEGRTAEDLPMAARILAAVDVFEALTAADRPYKPPLPPERVVRILRQDAAQRKLDPDVVEVLLEWQGLAEEG
ncbi:HD domain-containing phosphohydrolase [Deferrisoma camini]|uniref:HD domain-containing phosphohydrolase n=1 Tax=Deferrisoma camini TaxID=1035120 RepID=UPI00046D819B|nr:HD domain-containing phosphohydrolase [Deferrisoma camini]